MVKSLVLMNFSGVYEQEDFYKSRDYHFAEFREWKGVNCYCTPESEEKIKEDISVFPPEGIHFLDSGNYHYASKFWMEKIREPFSLLLFDNHTDMQEAAFFGLLSCGSWVREAIEQNHMLKKVCIVGPKEADFADVNLGEKVCFVTREALKKGNLEVFHSFLEQDDVPLYVSIDKDVLDRSEAVTNWDQGNMSLEELSCFIREAGRKRRCIGGDVCGENLPENGVCREEEACINNSANKKLLELLEKIV